MGLRTLFGGGRARSRAAAVRGAAAEAAEEDPLFAPDVVVDRAARLFVDIQAAWSGNDVARLRTMVGRELMVEWQVRLTDFARKGWRNEVDVLNGPQVDYVGLVNRAGTAQDRVVVRIEARVQDVVIDGAGDVLASEAGTVARVREFWTLGRDDGDWVLVSVEQEREGRHQLGAPLIAAPEADDRQLRADAVMELAVGDDVTAAQAGQLLSPGFTGSARAAALDLSLIDGRFAPDVLATAVGEIIEAWSRAVDGPDDALLALATPDALRALLYPTGSRDRLVIRGAKVRRSTITFVGGGPIPSVGLELDVEGVQYVEDRATTEVLSGTRRRPSATRQQWRLRLVDDPRRPWQITQATGIAPRR